jgi:hypothetical protein
MLYVFDSSLSKGSINAFIFLLLELSISAVLLRLGRLGRIRARDVLVYFVCSSMFIDVANSVARQQGLRLTYLKRRINFFLSKANERSSTGAN